MALKIKCITNSVRASGGLLRALQARESKCRNCFIVSRPGFALSLGIAFLLTACATGGGLTRKDILNQYRPINQLSNRIAVARGEQAALLAPQSFKDAEKYLEEAIEHARDAEKEKANQKAQVGLDKMKRVDANLWQSRDVFSEVLETRERARNAGAPDLFEERFKDADETLQKQAKNVEQGNINAARDSLPQLLESYSQLELDAIKKGTLEAAKQAVKHAEESEADEYAPGTLKRARQGLKLLTSIIEADRTQKEKADAHAKRTIWLARRAIEITHLAKRFEDENLDHEGIILWYQSQLLQIRSPLKNELPFDKPNSIVVKTLRQDIQGLMSSVNEMRDSQNQAQATIARLQREKESLRAQHERQLKLALADLRSGKEAKIAELEQTLALQASTEADAERRRVAAQQRLEKIQELFTPEQGDVLRMGDYIILRLHGFYFPPGKSTIEAKNFGLLNKIVTAINTFPNSQVKVIGHTDATGSDKTNLKLSMERAKNVEIFLNTTGEVPESRLTSEGRGESEPVASNSTKEGRAKNRRIEVLILTKGIGT